MLGDRGGRYQLVSSVSVYDVQELPAPTGFTEDAPLLELDDPSLAAAHFNWLIMSAPINRAMLLGSDKPPKKAELDRYVDSGVKAFLAAYGKR